MLTLRLLRTASPSRWAASISRHIRFKPFSDLLGGIGTSSSDARVAVPTSKRTQD